MKCYAAYLGDCSTKQSKEHYVSKGIWASEHIEFRGFSWLDGKAKKLPVKNVARKILCTKHNEQLSELDEEAKRLFLTGAEFHNHQFEREKFKRSVIWKPDRATFNGYKLERLFAKIAVGNLQEEPESRWHLTNMPAIEPPKEVVEVIYGKREFEKPMGLYFVNVVGDILHNQDEVTIHTMYHPDSNNYIGSIISFRNWQFFINLSDVNPDEYNMKSVTGKLIGKDGSPPVYRFQTINFNTKGKLSGQITIEW